MMFILEILPIRKKLYLFRMEQVIILAFWNMEKPITGRLILIIFMAMLQISMSLKYGLLR